MKNERKTPKADLKKFYTVFLETGIIMALLVIIILVKINIEAEPPEVIEVNRQEIIQMEEVVQTKQVEVPPPPPRPPVPVEVPNDEVIEEEVIDFDAELDMDAPMDLPPPPEEKEEEEDFFVVVEEMPELIGGMAALQASVKYPEMARRAGIEGRVTVQFVVNEKGEVENPRVIRGIGGGCDEAALEAVRNAKFKPGRQRGRPVRVQYALSINFRLEN